MVNNQTTLIEPSICWRPVDEPLANTKPTCLRLLQVCRLLMPTTLITEQPLARPTCSIIVKTADNAEYCFEAKTEAERDDTVRRWKASVARFASLAVLEDLDNIIREFVHAPTDQMLVPISYQQPQQQLSPRPFRP